MKLFQRHKPFIAFIASPTSLAIVVIQKGSCPKVLSSQTISRDPHVFLYNRINSFTHISRYLSTMIVEQKNNTPLYIALSDALITERFITLHNNHLPEGILIQQSSEPLIWYTTYLYHGHSTQHTWYACGLSPIQKIQWLLCTYKHRMLLKTLTSAWHAQHMVYKKMHGSTYRQAKLADDLIRTNYSFVPLIAPTALKQLIAIPPYIPHNEQTHTHLITALGLYIAGT